VTFPRQARHVCATCALAAETDGGLTCTYRAPPARYSGVDSGAMPVAPDDWCDEWQEGAAP
jgi:hypothetical protein